MEEFKTFPLLDEKKKEENPYIDENQAFGWNVVKLLSKN